MTPTLLAATRKDLAEHFDGPHAQDPCVAAEQVQGQPPADLADRFQAAFGDALPQDGYLLVPLPKPESDTGLARWRNALWPWLHLIGYYRSEEGQLVRYRLGSRKALGEIDESGAVLVLQRAAHVLSPAATTVKFDAAASSWNGNPGTPGYGHYRWMRRFVGLFTKPRSGDRILDFGCGAGWVGIEAAKRAANTELCSFDPSPQMVEITGENARANGISKFTGRVGFGDEPPFPKDGEERFDLVISSGVVSFAPSFEDWMDGLLSTLKPGGRLVIGDIDPTSRGMQKRRHERPLVPVRELNGCPRDKARAWLESHGLTHRKTAGYQLTTPIPQAMHISETRLKGVLSPPLLWANQGMAGLDRLVGGRIPGLFDSWVMAFDS